MKTKDEKEKFIELRASGLSFDRIAEKINVSKPTLIKWNVELKSEINNLEYCRYQLIISEYKLIQEKRIEFLCKELSRLNDAISKKNYEDASLKELILIRKELNLELNLEKKDKEYLTGIYEDALDFNLNTEMVLKL